MQIRQHDGDQPAMVVAPKGRLDASSSSSFSEQVRFLVEAGAQRIVVDLERVTFMDSAGVGGILKSLKRAREQGGTLRIARPQAQARMVLERTALTEVLYPFETVEEALSEAGPAAGPEP